MINKSELINKLTLEMELYLVNVKKIRFYMVNLLEKYNIPFSLSSDLIMLRNPLDSVSEFILFCITDVVKHDILEDYFLEKEILVYSKSRYNESNDLFPMKISALKISEDQYSCVFSLKGFMKLRDKQLIYYNENAQRTMQRVVNGDTEYYKISVNRKAVNSIVDALNNGTFIPNTITLNMPEDTDFEFKDGYLIINNLKSFDILDGYHRYLAMSNIYNSNPEFDYTMELRIVCFPMNKARQFIWQEDQKTKMRKIDSESLNQTNFGNQVVDMLNRTSVLYGKINRNNGIIDAATLSRVINLIWYHKNPTRSYQIETAKLIEESISNMEYINPKLLDFKWDLKDTICIMIGIDMKLPYDSIKFHIDNISKEVIGARSKLDASTIKRVRKIMIGGK